MITVIMIASILSLLIAIGAGYMVYKFIRNFKRELIVGLQDVKDVQQLVNAIKKL